MRILVLGAGVAGVTAAYALASRGHAVEVIEQESAAALQTSFANGGQLSYTHAEPWANPAVLAKALRWMFQNDAPLVLRPRADPAMLRWSLLFLRNCTAARARAHMETLLRIGLYSRLKLAEIQEATGVAFDYLAGGILHLYATEKDFAAARRQADAQAALGAPSETLARDECVAAEPALAAAVRPIAGGILSRLDASGDLHLFTQRLAAWCEAKLGVRFHYGVDVLGLAADGAAVQHVATSRGAMTADAYVMALGPWSAPLLRGVGLSLPIYPMKGYSVTVPAWDGAPRVSLTDDERKIVISRLGDRIRAAGTAEFAGYDTRVRASRVAPIARTLRELFPAAEPSLAAMETWACIRPQTPDGPPVVGATRHKNLFLHTGHGTLGWTMAAGTARILADLMEGKQPEISISGMEVARYA